ncbi:putative plant self-incompatibility S1 [Helianthus anomalus]
MSGMMNYLLVIVLTLCPFCCVTSSSHDRINAFEPYFLQIIDGDIEFLTTHCRSSNDDFGNKTMTIHSSFSWKFRRNIGETTRFVCMFWWKTADGLIYKETEFDVFNQQIGDECGKNLFRTNRCFWSVTQSGFYFAKGQPSNWMFKHSW